MAVISPDAPLISAGDRAPRARSLTLGLCLTLLITSVFGLAVGASDTSLWHALLDLAAGRELSLRDEIVLWHIRLPRLLTGLLVGAALATSGALLQGLFRNPLADPGIIGVSAGASLGAASAIVFGASLPMALQLGFWLVPMAAFTGAWGATLLLYRIATRDGRTSVATMLLAGIALSALAMAFTGLLTFLADDAQLRDISFWNLGSLSGANWAKLSLAAPLILLCLGLARMLANGLNGLALGEAAARHMGVSVQTVKRLAILCVAAATGLSVAISGGISFVGIVVPHLLRLIAGPDHRYLLINSALLGAIVLVIADVISRVIIAPSELPIGILTAILGGPFFLWILLRQRGIVDL
ncbi:iron ABC transporter permease [Shimia sp. R11_0]|uniref:FecCD family ABC transporter permease n=1 Tax=Shimia sp. R11_0 TaxID=2821096 RepID=UPI001ADB2542|nr:iron ABC transporter permease [Shimia sp. R11_0]MBO9478064.1 iron ABC transporter permease [Shimia sp. R11_0]